MTGLNVSRVTMLSGPVRVNTYLVSDGVTGEAMVIDPGGEVLRIAAMLEDRRLHLRWIVVTHGHFDHMLGAAELRRRTGAPICMHPADESFIRNSDYNAANFAGVEPVEPFAIDVPLYEGKILTLGKSELKVLHTPGHTPGEVSLYCPGHLFCGDTILRGTTGRMDLYGADRELCKQSIEDKIFPLPADVILYCGHNEISSVAYERENNDTAQYITD